jgi:hypothetical protein
MKGGAVLESLDRWADAAFGSGAPMMADTTATPSMALGFVEGVEGAWSWWTIRWRFEALTPPMQTVFTFFSASLPWSRYRKIFRMPLTPMMSLVFFLVFVAYNVPIPR